MNLTAPFSYFGGKQRIASEVWKRFGKVDIYIEPFFGSGAVMLANPAPADLEIVNDLNGYVANFWRAAKYAPDELAGYADWPINETDLHARHAWLRQQSESLASKLEADPDYYDSKIAGYWVWGASQWLGAGWCDDNPQWRTMPKVSGSGGIHKLRNKDQLYSYMTRLSARFKNTRVLCGDWTRCFPDHILKSGKSIAVFLDPPYDTGVRDDRLYINDKQAGSSLSSQVREWCIEQGKNKNIKIALAGYDNEHILPASWEVLSWKASGGYANIHENAGRGKENAARERIWFSEYCIRNKQLALI